jgi:hypothetical protein
LFCSSKPYCRNLAKPTHSSLARFAIRGIRLINQDLSIDMEFFVVSLNNCNIESKKLATPEKEKRRKQISGKYKI